MTCATLKSCWWTGRNNLAQGNLLQKQVEQILHFNTFLKRIGCSRTKFSGICVYNFDVPEDSPSQFPVNEAMWIMFMNSYMWAAAHCDNDRDQFKRVLRNMDVDQIQKVFTTTLNQVQSLQEIAPLSGLRDQLDWTGPPWKSCTFAGRQHLQTIVSKGVRLPGFCSVSPRKMPAPSTISRKWGARANFVFRRVSKMS